MRRKGLVSLLALFASSVCSGESPEGTNREEPIELSGVSCSNRGAFGLNLPRSIRAYRALGPRLREKGGGATDYSGEEGTHVWRNFEYKGLKVHAVFGIKEPYDGSFIESAEFSSPRWNRLTSIKIGMQVSRLLAQATSAVPQIKSPLLFCGALEGAPDCARVYFKKGSITKVQYECYTG